MEEKQIKILLERYEKHLGESYEKSTNKEEKKLIKHDQEMLKLGLNGITSSKYLFNSGDLVNITYQLGEEIKTMDVRILLFGEYYSSFLNENNNDILQFPNENILLMKMVEVPNEELFKALELGNKTYQSFFESKGNDSYT